MDRNTFGSRQLREGGALQLVSGVYTLGAQHVKIDAVFGLGASSPSTGRERFMRIRTRFTKGIRFALITLGSDRINSVERLAGITPWARAFFI